MYRLALSLCLLFCVVAPCSGQTTYAQACQWSDDNVDACYNRLAELQIAGGQCISAQGYAEGQLILAYDKLCQAYTHPNVDPAVWQDYSDEYDALLASFNQYAWTLGSIDSSLISDCEYERDMVYMTSSFYVSIWSQHYYNTSVKKTAFFAYGSTYESSANSLKSTFEGIRTDGVNLIEMMDLDMSF